MNVLFPLLFLFGSVWFLCTDPSAFLPALLSAAQRSAVLCFTLLASYALFLGLAELMEKSGLSRGLSRLLKPLIRALFYVQDDETVRCLSMNLAGNMLGISGVATPMGALAAERFAALPEREYNHTMLLVLNATSLQLLPTTVLSLLLNAGAKDAYGILLPSFLATCFCTLLGVALTLPLRRRRKA